MLSIQAFVHSAHTTPRAPAPALHYRRATSPTGLDCWVVQPAQADRTRAPLVAVHGISRNALEMAQTLADCHSLTQVAIVPCFDAQTWPSYQRLVRPARADLALLGLLQELAAEGLCQPRRFALFGYSGGAQFSHRFAMLYPHRIERLVLGAAGWYTLPDAHQPYPYGIGPNAASGRGWGRHFAHGLSQFLGLPIDVAVGARDDRADAATRSHPALDAQQGCDRLARARHWVAALRQAGQTLDVPTDIRFHCLPGCGHSFRQCATHGGLLQLIVGTGSASRSAARSAAAAAAAVATTAAAWRLGLPTSSRQPQPCV